MMEGTPLPAFDREELAEEPLELLLADELELVPIAVDF